MELLSSTPQTYTDLEIRILERQEQGYPVEITCSGEQEFPRGYLAPDILPWTPSYTPEEDGKRLFHLLFQDDTLKQVWAEVRGQLLRRRIRLRIDATAPELHVVPWEILIEDIPGMTPGFLTAGTDTPFSRYLAGQWRPGSPTLERPIKILAAIASPANIESYKLTALNIEEEQDFLKQAIFDDSLTPDLVELTFLDEPVTLPALEAELKKGYHILHIFAHGMFAKDQSAYLFLANADNQVERVKDDDVAAMLGRLGGSLRLVFLASCQTATRSSADAFRGFAPKLIQAGVPAVVAMQDFVDIDTAKSFSSAFYRQMLRHGQVDVAGNEARSVIMTAKLPGSAIPVLFMRLRSGQLFGQRGQILGERAGSFWSTLLENIADGECTPFLGPGVTRDLLPSPQELAERLGEDHNYPFKDIHRFPEVAQFVGTLDNRRLRKDVVRMSIEGFKRRMGLKSSPKDRRKTLCDIISASNWSEQILDMTESEIHHQLAELELPLYLTTNADNFMALALDAKGNKARREVVKWRDGIKQEAGAPYYDLDPEAAPEEPVVLHLFGTDDDLLSLVLTEDDYLDYLARISRDHEYLLPTSVNEALASTTLLFLGYRLGDLDLKVLMRGLLTHLDLERWSMLHVAVQIESETMDEAKQQEAIRYFQKYFGDARIDVYWGSTHQFVADLHAVGRNIWKNKKECDGVVATGRSPVPGV